MTVKELKALGYTWGDTSWQRGYIKRTGYDEDEQTVHVAGGSRKGQYYYLAPAKDTSLYCVRQYMVRKEA